MRRLSLPEIGLRNPAQVAQIARAAEREAGLADMAPLPGMRPVRTPAGSGLRRKGACEGHASAGVATGEDEMAITGRDTNLLRQSRRVSAPRCNNTSEHLTSRVQQTEFGES